MIRPHRPGAAVLNRRPPLALLALVFVFGLACVCSPLSALPSVIVPTAAPPTTPTVVPPRQSPAAPTEPPAPTPAPQIIVAPNPQAEEDLFVAIYRRSNPGVVTIRVLGETGGGLGSGFVVESDGRKVIVTNYHVVQDYPDDQIEVDFASGFKTRARVLARDLDSDLASLVSAMKAGAVAGNWSSPLL